MTGPTSKHLIDPELVAFIEAFPKFDLGGGGLADVRRKVSSGFTAFLDERVAQTEVIVGDGTSAPVRCLLFRPVDAKKPAGALLYLHPGGFVMGAPEQLAPRAAALAIKHECLVLCPAYRLAPEAPYPAQLDDAWVALQWLGSAEAGLIEADMPIILTGESAGGGLAACLALRARSEGSVRLAGQILVYPMLDDRTGRSIEVSQFAGEFGWTKVNNTFGWRSLLGEGSTADELPQEAVPARVADLGGLPPTHIMVGALDLLLDEDVEFARRLISAGVPTGLSVYPGAYHGFFKVAGARIAQAFLQDFDRVLDDLLKNS